MADPARLHLKARDRLSLLSDFSTMLSAGIPILEAVESLEIDAKGNMRQVLAILHKSLNNGQPLSSALEKLPRSFDAITINLVRAAEAGGTLEETLHDIVTNTKKELAFSDQLRTTMIYPAFVMVVFMGIVILMLTFVIPRIAKVFTAMRVHMPWITRQMIALSNGFVHHWILVTLVIIAGFVLLGVLIVKNKRLLIRGILSLPVLKVLGTNIDFTRFCRSFGLLMHAGVPLMEALELSEQVVTKKETKRLIHMMKTNLDVGKPLSEGLRRTSHVVPPLMSRSLETAERSGTLEQTLDHLTEYFDEQVANSLKVISSLIEPALLVVVGLMVGLLMITIIAPIYNLISQINPKG